MSRSRRELSNQIAIPTSIHLQNLASIQPRTIFVKFARSPRTDRPGDLGETQVPVDRVADRERSCCRCANIWCLMMRCSSLMCVPLEERQTTRNEFRCGFFFSSLSRESMFLGALRLYVVCSHNFSCIHPILIISYMSLHISIGSYMSIVVITSSKSFFRGLASFSSRHLHSLIQARK